MSAAGPGIAAFGELFIGSVSTNTDGCAGLILGPVGNIIINNTTDPPQVSIGGGLVSRSSAEYYNLISSNTTVANSDYIEFPQTAAISLASEDVVSRPTTKTIRLGQVGGAYEITWQATVAEAPVYFDVYVLSGAVSTQSGPAPSEVQGTQVGSGLANSQIVGTSILVVVSPATIAIRNVTGSSVTLVGNAGGSNAVATNIVVRLLAQE